MNTLEVASTLRDTPALAFASSLLCDPDDLLPRSDVQRAAIELHVAGLNVIPLPRVTMKDWGGKKPPYGPYSILFTTRLHADDLPVLFERANVGVLAGRLSHNLFILDCDSPRELERIGAELSRRNIKPWITTSGRGGHYWLRCAEGEVASAKLSDMLQVIGTRGYVVAPPSVHPSGILYEWVRRDGKLPGLVSSDDLDFLSLSLVKARRGQLPKVAKQVLADRSMREYASWSEAELAAAMSLAKAGNSEVEIVEAFERYNPPHFAEKRSPADWLRRYVIPKAVAQAAGDRQKAHAGIAWANSRAWPGRSGESDHALCVALCRRKELDGREHFRASERELSELSGLTIPTVIKSLARLERTGLFKREGHDKTSGATLFSLHISDGRKLITVSPCSGSDQLTPNSDAWHRLALGKSACSVWRVLLTRGDLTREEIAEATGRTARTVGRALEKLRTHGMAEPIGTRWAAEPIGAEGLRRIAAVYGTTGVAETRRARYSEARAIRASRLIMRQKALWERARCWERVRAVMGPGDSPNSRRGRGA